MASFRRIAIALTIIAAAGSAALSDAAAQSAFSRCPKAEHFNDVMKQLVAATDRSRAMAEENPLLLADVGFYETELAATKRCTPSVAIVMRPTR
jgi:hypothetical protein